MLPPAGMPPAAAALAHVPACSLNQASSQLDSHANQKIRVTPTWCNHRDRQVPQRWRPAVLSGGAPLRSRLLSSRGNGGSPEYTDW